MGGTDRNGEQSEIVINLRHKQRLHFQQFWFDNLPRVCSDINLDVQFRAAVAS